MQIGPRTQVLAHALIHTLGQVTAPGFVPLFSSNGHDLYFYALTAHFGQWVQTGGEKKRQWQVETDGLLKRKYGDF